MFYYIGGSAYRAIAKYNNTSYSTLNGGMYGLNPYVQTMAVYNNNIIVGCGFDGVNGMYAPNLVGWNGTSWHKLKDEYLNSPCDLVVDSINNFLYVASQQSYSDTASGMKRWDGYNWEDLLMYSPAVASGPWTGIRSWPNKLCIKKNYMSHYLHSIR